MATAVPGTVNTLQNGFNIAGSAPQRTAPINFGAINMTPTAPKASNLSQVSAVAPAVSSTPTQQPIDWNAISFKQPVQQTPPPVAQSNPQVSPPPQTPAPVNNGLVNPQNLNPGPSATFPGIVGSLAQTSQQGTPIGQQYTQQTGLAAQGNIPIGQSAADIAANYGQQIADVGQQAAMGEAGYRTTGTTPVAEGNAAVVQQTAAARQQALAQGEQAALLGTGQQLTAQQQAEQGFNAAGGLAQTQQGLTQSGLVSAGQLSQPSAGTSYFGNPLTGGIVGQGAGGGGVITSPVQALPGIAQKIASGLMSPQDGLNAVGPSLASSLQAMVSSISPGFNFNQANVNAGIQGQLGPQAQLAQGELTNLMTALNASPQFQQTTFPLINSMAAYVNGLYGNKDAKALEDARTAATSAVGTALATAYGGTPTTYDGLISTWFPPNGSPSQVLAGIQQFNSLIGYRTGAYGSPGTVPQPTATQTPDMNGAPTGWGW